MPRLPPRFLLRRKVSACGRSRVKFSDLQPTAPSTQNFCANRFPQATARPSRVPAFQILHRHDILCSDARQTIRVPAEAFFPFVRRQLENDSTPSVESVEENCPLVSSSTA